MTEHLILVSVEPPGRRTASAAEAEVLELLSFFAKADRAGCGAASRSRRKGKR